MSGVPGVLGVVLAGGGSRRFGSDKGRAVLDGLTLRERAARTLDAVCDHVVVAGPAPSPQPTGSSAVEGAGASGRWPAIADAEGARGPVAGIVAALGEAERRGLEAVVVLACDLPLVEAPTVEALVTAYRAGRPPRAVAPSRAGDPVVEPLCAVYPTACAPSARALVAEGVQAAHELFERVGGHTIAFDPAPFLNVNTTADLEAAARALRERTRPPAVVRSDS